MRSKLAKNEAHSLGILGGNGTALEQNTHTDTQDKQSQLAGQK